MFNNKKIKNLRNEVNKLSDRIYNLESNSKIVGWFYDGSEVKKAVPTLFQCWSGITVSWKDGYKWRPFYKIDEEVNGNIKINGLWYIKSEIIFNNYDPYKNKKNCLERKIKERMKCE